MRKIKLTNGGKVLVDDGDFDVVNRVRWCKQKIHKTYYAKHNKILLHRFIMGPKKGEVIDHIDGNGLNNIRQNLRICTQFENMRNQRRHREGRLFGAILVASGKYLAQIKRRGKSIYLGTFATEQQAHEAFLKADQLLTP